MCVPREDLSPFSNWREDRILDFEEEETDEEYQQFEDPILWWRQNRQENHEVLEEEDSDSETRSLDFDKNGYHDVSYEGESENSYYNAVGSPRNSSETSSYRQRNSSDPQAESGEIFYPIGTLGEMIHQALLKEENGGQAGLPVENERHAGLLEQSSDRERRNGQVPIENAPQEIQQPPAAPLLVQEPIPGTSRQYFPPVTHTMPAIPGVIQGLFATPGNPQDPAIIWTFHRSIATPGIHHNSPMPQPNLPGNFAMPGTSRQNPVGPWVPGQYIAPWMFQPNPAPLMNQLPPNTYQRPDIRFVPRIPHQPDRSQNQQSLLLAMQQAGMIIHYDQDTHELKEFLDR